MSLDYVIRPFAPHDQAAARRLILNGLGDHFGLIDESLNPDLDDIMQQYVRAGHAFWVVEAAGEVVGTGALITEAAAGSTAGRIVRVSVGRAYRRLGIGRALVNHLIEVARRQGLKRVLVETNLEWYDAIGLYQRCGFREIERDEGSVYMGVELGE